MSLNGLMIIVESYLKMDVPNKIVLSEYQQECVDAIAKAGNGRHLIVMATGLGKTVTFASIPRHGRTLLLSHRDELVRQPQKTEWMKLAIILMLSFCEKRKLIC